MTSFGQQPPEDEDKDNKPLAAPALAPTHLEDDADDLLPSPRRRELDSFEPLLSMPSFDDHHHFLVDDDNKATNYMYHNTMIHGRVKHDDIITAANNDTASRTASSLSRRKTSNSSSSTAGDDDHNSTGAGILQDGLPMPMADLDDEIMGFSLTICFVRQQLEFFLADQKDANARRKKGGVSGNIQIGSLGFRCIHCKHLPPTERAPSADAYPNQVQLIYQAVRNFQRHHLLKCRSVPQHLKDQYQTIPRRQKSKRQVHKHTDPWVYSAKRKGILNVEDDTSKGGYRIAYSPPNVISSSNTTTSIGSTSTGEAATASSSSSPSSSFVVTSSSYYGTYHVPTMDHAISTLAPSPIQAKEPRWKKPRCS